MNIVFIIMGILFPIIIIYIIYKYLQNKQILDDEKLYRKQFKNLVDNSFDCIKLLDDTIQRVATYQFHTFTDTHHMDKINTTHIKQLVESISIEIKDAFNSSWNIIPLYVLYDTTFIYNYIANATALYIKELLTDYITRNN